MSSKLGKQQVNICFHSEEAESLFEAQMALSPDTDDSAGRPSKKQRREELHTLLTSYEFRENIAAQKKLEERNYNLTSVAIQECSENTLCGGTKKDFIIKVTDNNQTPGGDKQIQISCKSRLNALSHATISN